MGLRGPAPKPTALKRLLGNPGRRPLPENEPQYQPGEPVPPFELSTQAKKVWQTLVREMKPSGVLRRVDGAALAQLCEDQALLNELREGLAQLKKDYLAKAKAEGKSIPGNALVAIIQSTNGRRILSTMQALASQIIVQRREFGLTPASNSRVCTVPGESQIDELERALCGYPDDLVQ